QNNHNEGLHHNHLLRHSPRPSPTTRPSTGDQASPPAQTLSPSTLQPPPRASLPRRSGDAPAATEGPTRQTSIYIPQGQSGSVETGRSSPVTGVSLEVREMLERSMSIRWDEGIGLAGCVWLMALVTVVVVVVVVT
ncbi:unnamed protein product, partial [Fusarium graminearum]